MRESRVRGIRKSFAVLTVAAGAVAACLTASAEAAERRVLGELFTATW